MSKMLFGFLVFLITVLGSFTFHYWSVAQKHRMRANSLAERIAQLQLSQVKLQRKLTFLDKSYKNVQLLTTDHKGIVWKKYVSPSNDMSFTMEYPQEWNMESTVFVDEKTSKVAEFSPGLFYLKKNEPCFKDIPAESIFGEKVLKRELVSVGKYKGELEIAKIGYEGGSPNWNGTWYPNTYCIRYPQDKAFKITFYEYTELPKNSALYMSILTRLSINDGSSSDRTQSEK